MFQILIQERNEYMRDKIVEYFQQNPSKKIVVITGAGHTEDLMQMVMENLASKMDQ
jgi:pheromone shutdown protein TraB